MVSTQPLETGERLRCKQSHFIDSHKAATPVFILLLMTVYHAWDNPTAWIYFALHGSYGALWVTKGRLFPDKQFVVPCTVGRGLVVWVALSLYWVGAWLVMARHVQAPPWFLGMCVVLHAFGVFLHFVADMQKHMHMQHCQGTLLTSGLWAHCRNPNYFGELLIYLGFGLLAMHWLPVVILGAFVLGVWVPNMRRKDTSLARYPEFASWKARSTMLIPYLI